MLVSHLINIYDKLGLWTSVFALGAFVGPTLAGILFDAVGFPLATVFILVAELAALVALFIGFLRTLRFVLLAIIRCAVNANINSMRRSRSASAVAKDDDDEEDSLIQNHVNDGYGATVNAQQESAEQRRARIR